MTGGSTTKGSRMASRALWVVAALAVVATIATPFRAAYVFAPSEHLELYELIGRAFGLLLVPAVAYWRWRPAGARGPLLVIGVTIAIFLVTMHSVEQKYAEPYPPDHRDLEGLSKGCIAACEGERAQCESACRCVLEEMTGRRPRSEIMDIVAHVAEADRKGNYDDPRVQAFAEEAADARAACGFP
jgi:hypothetical protein